MDGRKVYYQDDDARLWDNSRVGHAGTQMNTTDPKAAVSSRKLKLHVIPPVALLEMGKALTNGAYGKGKEYGLMNWRNSEVRFTTYYDATMRHLLALLDGEDVARDSLIQHMAHAMATLAIMIDALSVGTMIDDRPTPGKAADVMEAALKE